MSDLTRFTEESRAVAVEKPTKGMESFQVGSSNAILDTLRAVFDDEDVITGRAPVEELVLPPTQSEPLPEDAPIDLEDDEEEGEDPEDIDAWTDPEDDEFVGDVVNSGWDEKSSLLSKVPLEALYYALNAMYANEDVNWWDLEIAVIVEDLSHVRTIDAAGAQRLAAFHTFLRSMASSNAFYQDPVSFAFLVCSMSGRLVRWNEHDLEPTAMEIGVAMNVALKFRPGIYSDAVLGFIAASCIRDGHWVLPGILTVAQEKVLSICKYMQIPVDSDRIDKVRNLPDPGVDYDPEGDDGSVDFTQARAYHGLDNALDAAIARGEEAATRVLEAFGDAALFGETK